MTPSPDSVTGSLTPFGTLSDGTKIVLLSWNDLGMHCYTPDFSAVAVLPPYNNLYAQVVKVGRGDPRILKSGFTVEYSFPENTYSVGSPGKPEKSNFWTYAEKLFGKKLAPDIGLTGRGLTGTFDQKENYFIAEGIPLTDINDSDATSKKLSPYQKARVVVKDSATGKEVAGLTVVTPVSTEMRCDTCHSDAGKATKKGSIKPTGDVYLNILTLHDKLHAADFQKLGAKLLMDSRPVLCASCHGSNALGAPGTPGTSSLSNAMHKRHSTEGIPATTEGCQNCHPGPETKCLRDVHEQTLHYQCPECHGDLAKVATNPQPWLNEPRCDTAACHKNMTPAKIKQTKPLFRQSKGMGGLMCEACHDSTHALAKARTGNDNIKFEALQGDAGPLHRCAICHGKDKPDGQTSAHAQDD